MHRMEAASIARLGAVTDCNGARPDTQAPLYLSFLICGRSMRVPN
jgi:hypothetical protein